MVVGFATNYAISAYPHYSCQFSFIVFTATFKNISVLLVEETGVSEKTTDLSQVPCKHCIENTFLERDFN
jgi:hypothetical protein